jgi:hypothetical protein
MVATCGLLMIWGRHAHCEPETAFCGGTWGIALSTACRPSP